MTESQRVVELQRQFDEIYADANRTLSVAEILMRLDEQAGYLGKLVMDGKDCEAYLVKSLSWLFALANRLSIDLETAFLQKFPSRCGYCLNSPCICDATNKTPQFGQDRHDELFGAYHTLRNSVVGQTIVPNLQFFSKLIETIYPVNFTRWKENRAVFLVKLAEERAEIIEAYRRHAATPTEYTKEPLAAELADYLAWLLAISTVEKRASRRYNVQAALAERYRYGCPYCRKPVCECPESLRHGIRSDSALGATSEYEPDPVKRLSGELTSLLGELRKHEQLRTEADRLGLILNSLATASQSDILAVLTATISALAGAAGDVPNAEAIRTLVRGVCEWLPPNWRN